MSARRQSYRPYEPVAEADLYRAYFGEQKRREPADTFASLSAGRTPVSLPTESSVWLEGLADAVKALGAGAFVLVSWAVGRVLLGVN